jgi:hypothetical protein
MSKLPNNDPQDAEASKIYLSEEGSYCIRRGDEVLKGSLKGLDLNNLATKLENKSFIDSVVSGITIIDGEFCTVIEGCYDIAIDQTES